MLDLGLNDILSTRNLSLSAAAQPEGSEVRALGAAARMYDELVNLQAVTEVKSTSPAFRRFVITTHGQTLLEMSRIPVTLLQQGQIPFPHCRPV